MPHAARPRPRPAEPAPRRYSAARIGVEAREVAAGVKAGQPAAPSANSQARSTPAVAVAHDPRHGSHRRKLSSSGTFALGRAVTRPRWPRPGRRAGLSRGRRGLRRHVRTISLLQIRDLAGTRLRGQRRRGFVPCHSPAGGGVPTPPRRRPRPPRQASDAPEIKFHHARGRPVLPRGAGPNRSGGELLG